MTRRSKARAVLLCLSFGAALSACGKPAQEAAKPAQARAVTVARVEAVPIEGSLTGAGSLVPREEAAVIPEVTGFRVAKVLVDAGAYVQAGQVLAQMDPTLINAQVDQQRAALAQARIRAEQAEAEASRVTGLDGQGVLSQEQIETRRFQARTARAAADVQAAALRDAQTRASKLSLTAPVSGLVLERNVRPGDLGGAGTQPWFRIAQDGQIELAAELPEEDLARVRIGQPASVTLPSGVVVEGRVRLVSPQVAANTKLGVVRITLPVRNDIRAGGFGRAVFGQAVAEGLSVPETAVRYDADGASVMLVAADNRVRRFPVQTGARGGGRVTLVKGPPAGSRVVANAGAFLLDGDRVKPLESSAGVKPSPLAPAALKSGQAGAQR